MRTIRFAGISLILCLFIAFVLFTLSVHSAPANGVSGNRFKNSAPDPLAGGDNGLRNPADFEAALASRPDPTGKVFVSRCRFAPFSNSTSLYTPFAGTQTTDAVVGDTRFFEHSVPPPRGSVSSRPRGRYSLRNLRT